MISFDDVTKENIKEHNPIQQTFVGLQDAWKTSSRHVFRTSSTRLQGNNFLSLKTFSRRLAKTSWRSLEDVLKTSHKTSWRCLGRRKIVTLEDVFKTSWRQAKCLLGMSLSNKSKCVSNKSIFDESKANPKCIN